MRWRQPLTAGKWRERTFSSRQKHIFCAVTTTPGPSCSYRWRSFKWTTSISSSSTVHPLRPTQATLGASLDRQTERRTAFFPLGRPWRRFTRRDEMEALVRWAYPTSWQLICNTWLATSYFRQSTRWGLMIMTVSNHSVNSSWVMSWNNRAVFKMAARKLGYSTVECQRTVCRRTARLEFYLKFRTTQGAVANRLRRRTSDQTVLGSNPAVAAALSPWTRLFTPIVPRRSLHISFY